MPEHHVTGACCGWSPRGSGLNHVTRWRLIERHCNLIGGTGTVGVNRGGGTSDETDERLKTTGHLVTPRAWKAFMLGGCSRVCIGDEHVGTAANRLRDTGRRKSLHALYSLHDLERVENFSSDRSKLLIMTNFARWNHSLPRTWPADISH